MNEYLIVALSKEHAATVLDGMGKMTNPVIVELYSTMDEAGRQKAMADALAKPLPKDIPGQHTVYDDIPQITVKDAVFKDGVMVTPPEMLPGFQLILHMHRPLSDMEIEVANLYGLQIYTREDAPHADKWMGFQ